MGTVVPWKQQLMKKKEFKVPQLWTKCPGCKSLLYIKGVLEKNKCEECGYIFPYPVVKTQEFKELLRKKGVKRTDVGKFVLKTLESLKSKKKKIAFLCETHGLVIQDYEWKQMQKNKRKK